MAAKIVAALFRTREEGQAAHNQLLASGFTREQVSFIAGTSPDREGSRELTTYLTDAIGVAVEAMALLVPGTGPLVAAGPLAGAITQVGSKHESIASILLEHGVSAERAAYYEEGIRRGGALVAVHDATDEAENRALAVLEQSGAIKSEELASEES
jgi:hypothetical protein